MFRKNDWKVAKIAAGDLAADVETGDRQAARS